MPRSSINQVIVFSFLLIFVLGVIGLSYYINPTELVRNIGVQNGYLLAFGVSFFGGFSAAGSISFIALITTLVLGGMNPWYLGIVSGISLTIGDLIMFYTGIKGRELVSDKWDRRINWLAEKIMARPWLRRLTPIIAYAYIGLTPLPNDILIILMAAIKYPPKQMTVIITLGSITFALLITTLTAAGFLIN